MYIMPACHLANYDPGGEAFFDNPQLLSGSPTPASGMPRFLLET
jgi:hypothetical protein